MTGTGARNEVSTKLERIAELARRNPEAALTTLAHHIDANWMQEAYRRTRKDGAPGIDGQTGHEYADNLESRLADLLDRAKSGRYRAPPVRRVHIPKGNGETRPLGLPTFEDKVLQRAIAMVLEAVYEQTFYDCSYGFRPGRSAHQAIEAFREATMEMRGGWVIELDIRKYFDTIDHGKLREVLSQRVHDGVIMRLIGKWLKAGVMEKGVLFHSEAGTPQGGVISPLLANVFLHEVLDAWFHEQVLPRLRGRARLVRYADDAVLLFEREEDANRVLEVLSKRFARFGLTLHPEKTRMVDFVRPPFGLPRKRDAGPRGPKAPRSLDFLGFTIHWAKSLRGNWIVRVRTARKRFRRGLRGISDWCAAHRHAPLRVQQEGLNAKLRGHYGYFGRVGNRGRLWAFRDHVRRTWKRELDRRSQRRLTWERMQQLLKRFPLLKPNEYRGPQLDLFPLNDVWL